MTNVTYKYRTKNAYGNSVYKQKTIEMEIPVDEHGYTLPDEISKKIKNLLDKNEVLLWHQVKN